MKRWIQILIALLFLDSAGIFWIWGVALVDGAFQDGLFAYQEGNIPIFHLTAEFGMALVTLAGLYGWWHNRSWGRGITLLGMGMFTYSAVNSMGWAIHNDVPVSARGRLLRRPLSRRPSTCRTLYLQLHRGTNTRQRRAIPSAVTLPKPP